VFVYDSPGFYNTASARAVLKKPGASPPASPLGCSRDEVVSRGLRDPSHSPCSWVANRGSGKVSRSRLAWKRASLKETSYEERETTNTATTRWECAEERTVINATPGINNCTRP